jgi:hypothetical protein
MISLTIFAILIDADNYCRASLEVSALATTKAPIAPTARESDRYSMRFYFR